MVTKDGGIAGSCLFEDTILVFRKNLSQES
jgi:hypothetical protein